MRLILILPLTFLTGYIYSQTLTFTDQGLKQLLITENCVDTDGDTFYDEDVDTNDNNEIEVSEAFSVVRLKIQDLNQEYLVNSIVDLNSFSNLQELSVTNNMNLAQIAGLELENLNTLRLSNNSSLRHVDITGLDSLTKDLRIEDCTLDYLNTKNENVAEYFSMFYCINIQYACVDSMASEYDKVLEAMLPGNIPDTENCLSISSIDNAINNNDIILNPNPTNGLFIIESSYKIDNLTLFDLSGRQLKNHHLQNNEFDISGLIPGLYLIKIGVGKNVIHKKIIKI